MVSPHRDIVVVIDISFCHIFFTIFSAYDGIPDVSVDDVIGIRCTLGNLNLI